MALKWDFVLIVLPASILPPQELHKKVTAFNVPQAVILVQRVVPAVPLVLPARILSPPVRLGVASVNPVV